MLASMGMDMQQAAGASASEVFARQMPHLSSAGIGWKLNHGSPVGSPIER
jgi:hypothetical protein